MFGAPGLTVRVGFSTSCPGEVSGSGPQVHLGSPSGWDSQPDLGIHQVPFLGCTRAHRPGGILNQELVAMARTTGCVHPGSPSGWDSQRRWPGRGPRPARPSALGLTVRVGFSTPGRGGRCPCRWPGAPGLTVRVGFSTCNASSSPPCPPGAPGLTVRVGFSTYNPRRASPTTAWCTRAHRPGGILNVSGHQDRWPLRTRCTRAHRPGGILNWIGALVLAGESVTCTRAHRPGGILNGRKDRC